MLNFIVMTISIALGIVIATGVMMVIMMQPFALKWYAKQSMKLVENMTKDIDTELEAK